MKKAGILNRDVAAVVAGLRHFDVIIVSDAGFPVPPGVPSIDLVVGPGKPPVMDVVEMVMTELEVEELILAEETGRDFPDSRTRFIEAVPGAEVKEIPVEEFRRLADTARAVVRSGEFTKYHNIALVAGTTY